MNTTACKLHNNIVDNTFAALPYVIITVLFVFSMFYVDVGLAVTALACVALTGLVSHFMSKLYRYRLGRFELGRKALNEYERDVFGKLKAISTHNLAPLCLEHYEKLQRRLQPLDLSRRSLIGLRGVITTLLVFISFATLLSMGIVKVEDSGLKYHALMGLLMYACVTALLISPLHKRWHRLIASSDDLNAVVKLFATHLPLRQRANAYKLIVRRGEVQFHDVWFKGHNSTQILKHADFFVDGGETVALVGPSETAKAALIELLLRFHDPDHGSVTIDGSDLRDITLASLRRSVGMLWDKPYILNDTVRANLLATQPDADDADIITACQTSHAWEFISRFEQGLDTPLGINGMVLSTDQALRLAICQLLLRDPPILCIDESATLISKDSNECLEEALEHLRVGRTAFILARRLSTVQQADSVLYLSDDGTLQQAPHDELLLRHASYRSAVHWQTRGP